MFKINNILEKYTGCKYNYITLFGRSALYLLLTSLRVEGKEILVPALICDSITNTIIKAGASPVFIDVNPSNFTLDLEDLKAKITPKTVALLFVHYFGYVYPDIEKLKAITKKYRLFLIEDCAHSLGASYGNKKVGSIGDASIFSLTKNMPFLGGGVLATNNLSLNDLIFKEYKKFYQQEQNIFIKCRKFLITMVYLYKLWVDYYIYDRPKKSIFKWWLINLPEYFLFPLYLIKRYFFKKGPQNNYLVNRIKEDQFLNAGITPLNFVFYFLKFYLKKIEINNQKRREIIYILEQQILNPNLHLRIVKDKKCVHASTFLVIHLKNRQAKDVVSFFKKKGVLLRCVWPVFQDYLREQQTQNIREIANKIALLRINPYLTQQEINYLVSLFNEI